MATKVATQVVRLEEWLKSYMKNKISARDGVYGVEINDIDMALKAEAIRFDFNEIVDAINELIRQKILKIDLLFHPSHTVSGYFAIRIHRYQEPPHSDVEFPL